MMFRMRTKKTQTVKKRRLTLRPEKYFCLVVFAWGSAIWNSSRGVAAGAERRTWVLSWALSSVLPSVMSMLSRMLSGGLYSGELAGTAT